MLKSLACSAMQPGLRSILVWDADIPLLKAISDSLAFMIENTSRNKIDFRFIHQNATEDELWGIPFAIDSDIDIKQNFSPLLFKRKGILTDKSPTDQIAIVLIPDLTQVSIATARSLVMLMDSPEAYYERHGIQHKWTPNLCWIAGCPLIQAGQPSKHLLDRFTLRLTANKTEENNSKENRATNIKEWLKSNSPTEPISINYILNRAQELATDVPRKNEMPTFDTKAIESILRYTKSDALQGHRKDISLARLSRGLAHLDGETVVQSKFVHRAARLIGLKPPEESSTSLIDSEDKEHESKKDDKEKESTQDRGRNINSSTDSGSEQESKKVSKTVKAQTTEEQANEHDSSFLININPYAEEDSPILNEYTPLRMPVTQRNRIGENQRGIVVGTESTSTLNDLALIPTLREAAKYKRLRKKDAPEIYPSDLRRYRRLPAPAYLLVLLLDYTSLKNCKWQDAILPHLQWAYTHRAPIILIQVGVHRASFNDEIRSKAVRIEKVLSPSLDAALAVKPGRATPLADGLDLARKTLQKALRKGRSTIHQARLVVLSDGRGNVPLSISQGHSTNKPVTTEGITDAREQARLLHDQIRKEDVDVIFLDPQPKYYTHLPELLSSSLGATHFLIDREQ